jgi:hypothetical protein
MKNKLCILILALSFSVTLQAQYFQITNGYSGSDETVGDGISAISGGVPVHLVAGSTRNFGSIDLQVSKLDINGGVPGLPYFNQGYRLFNGSGSMLTAEAEKILQLGSGNICVVGNYSDPSKVNPVGIFTLILNSNGTVINATGWQTILPAVSNALRASSACLSQLSNDIVCICGYSEVLTQGGGLRPIAIAINANTNTLLWGHSYDFLSAGSTDKVRAYDIAAGNYFPDGDNELLIVGTFHYSNAGNTDDGFTFRVNAVSGNPIGTISLFDNNRNNSFHAVSLASGSGGGSNGYVITGSTDTLGNVDAITIKVNTAGDVIFWSTIHDYSINGAFNNGVDIIERLDSNFEWHYYLCGTVYHGVFGGPDAYVVILHDTDGIASYEYTYGTAYKEAGNKISSFTGTVADGINVYGYTDWLNDYNQYIVKAYFNGVSGCNEYRDKAVSKQYPLVVNRELIAHSAVFSSTVFSAQILSPAIISRICFSSTISTGSNARTVEPYSETASSNAETSLYPNPLSQSEPALNLSLHSPVDQQIEIRITDMLGREVLNQKIIITSGQNIHQLLLPSSISSGVYNLSILGESFSEQQRFTVE